MSISVHQTEAYRTSTMHECICADKYCEDTYPLAEEQLLEKFIMRAFGHRTVTTVLHSQIFFSLSRL